MDKRILFILFLLVGSTVAAISINYSFGAAHITEYVALFTSVSTAVYAILAQPKQRTEPFLRITPLLKTHATLAIAGKATEAKRGLEICIENIGYSIAKDIEVSCGLSDDSIYLENAGIFKHPFLAPKESVKYPVVRFADAKILLSQQLIIEASYLNEDDKKQKPIKNVYSVEELHEGLKEVKTS
jgi:hypothetical protein